MKINIFQRFPHRTAGILTLGMLCVVGSFAIGIRTAGNVRPISPLEAETAELQGDINGNGEIDLKDIVAILEVAQGYRQATVQELRADPNGDGTLSVDDALRLLYDLST